MFVYIFLSVFVVIVLLVISLLLKKPTQNKGGSDTSTRKISKKDKSAILKKSTKRLARNPKDPTALKALGELYFNENDYDKAVRAYSLLSDQVRNKPNHENFDIFLKYGISLLQTGNRKEAYLVLLDAHTVKKNNFDLNYYLGYIEYLNGNYAKALSYLNVAKSLKPDHLNTIRTMGLAFYKEQRTREAIIHLKHAIKINPKDKESIFALAQSSRLAGQNELAHKLFSQLRTDPTWGALAALNAGKICITYNKYDEAAEHFEAGLKHSKIPAASKLELKYYLANIYIKQQNLTQAITLLKEVDIINPEYKDTKQLIAKYSDLVTNNNLRIFLMGGNSEFANICRKLIDETFKKAQIKVVDMSIVKNLYLDILVEVNTRKWEDIVLFRFIRNTGQVSDLLVRELHAKLKEERAGRAFCFTAGFFTEEATRFVEARLIDLIERERLEKMLKTIEPDIF